MTTPLAQPPEKYEQRWMFLLYKRIMEIESDPSASALVANQIFSRKDTVTANNDDASAVIAHRIFGG